MKLKRLDLRLLSELVKNAKSSDRLIAKKLRVSQPTITRKRARLESDLALRYTTIPDWEKLGLQILAFTFAKWKHKTFPTGGAPAVKSFISKHPSVIFASSGNGLESDRVCVSLHKGYREYYRFKQEIREQWSKYVDKLDSFVISFGGDSILRQLTFKPLAESIGQLE